MITNVGDVEEFLNGFFLYVGGNRIDKEVPKDVSFNNAAYKVDFLSLIIELKSLEISQFEQEPASRKLFDTHKPHLDYLRSKEAQLIPPMELARQTLIRFSQDIEKVAYSRIKKIVSKANKQIKETKINIHLNNYCGTLWIVNENNLYLTVKNQVNIISRILESDLFSSIDCVILSNLNMGITKGEESPSNLYWIPVFRESSIDATWNEIHYIGHCWQEYIRDKFSIPKEVKSFCGYGDMEYFTDFKNVKYPKP